MPAHCEPGSVSIVSSQSRSFNTGSIKGKTLNIQWVSYSSEKNLRPANDGESTSGSASVLFFKLRSLTLLSIEFGLTFYTCTNKQILPITLILYFTFRPISTRIGSSLTSTLNRPDFKKDDDDALCSSLSLSLYVSPPFAESDVHCYIWIVLPSPALGLHSRACIWFMASWTVWTWEHWLRTLWKRTCQLCRFAVLFNNC